MAVHSTPSQSYKVLVMMYIAKFTRSPCFMSYIAADMIQILSENCVFILIVALVGSYSFLQCFDAVGCMAGTSFSQL